MGRSYVMVSAASLPEALTTRGGMAVGLGIAAVAIGAGDTAFVVSDPPSPHADTARHAKASVNERLIEPL
jgi:hypothetical protein